MKHKNITISLIGLILSMIIFIGLCILNASPYAYFDPIITQIGLPVFYIISLFFTARTFGLISTY